MLTADTALPAAFLDRDGVINRDHGYVSRWEDFEFLPGVVDALQRLQSLGFRLVVITNQSGIGRGYYSEADYQRLTARLTADLSAKGVELTAVYHCPHHPEAALAAYRTDCACRKPAPGMLLSAAKAHQLDLGASILVGDKPSDIAAGRAAGVARCYHVTADAADPGAIAVTSLADAVRREALQGQKS